MNFYGYLIIVDPALENSLVNRKKEISNHKNKVYPGKNVSYNLTIRIHVVTNITGCQIVPTPH
mgnify:FL=1